MRILLYTGTGGAGCTTVAAATALAVAVAAEAGHRTLLLSTDPSVADVLDVPVDADPSELSGVPGLDVAVVDVRDRFEAAWSGVRGWLVETLAGRALTSLRGDEVMVPPGAHQVVPLLDLQSHVTSGRYDVIVLDAPAGHDLVRLLAAPEALAFFWKQAGGPARLLRLAGGFSALAGLFGAGSEPRPDSGSSPGLLERMSEVRELLVNPDVTVVRLVTTPGRIGLAEARRLVPALALQGAAVQAVLLNRATAGRHSTAPESVPELAQLPLWRVPVADAEPIGVERLTELAAALSADCDLLAGAARSVEPWVTEADAGYQLRVPLPLVVKEGADLTRSGDDLVLTAGSDRRRLSLPSVLRRCRTTSARWDEDTLVVDFEPDPKDWPAGLRRPQPEAAATDGADPNPAGPWDGGTGLPVVRSAGER